MKPSIAYEPHREEIRRIVEVHRGLNPRVFGSVLHGTDTEQSDLDILIDGTEKLSLFDMARMAAAIEELVGKEVDLKTPEDLPEYFRHKVVAEARPI
jgi:predicted nucleotidyltransferase